MSFHILVGNHLIHSTCVEKKKLKQISLEQIHESNISTCVEKTTKIFDFITGTKKHLHMRGENTSLSVTAILRKETSPHAWRKLYKGQLDAQRDRNISTCVEKT